VSLNNSFTNWDDDDYVINNHLIRQLSFQNIPRIFSPATLVNANYQPMTILSLAISYAMGGLNPKVYIATDIVLHLLNVLLVFIFIWKLTGSDRIAGICATLFGIHPMHVESVAWVTGRKDVLYAFFYLSALLCYLWYRGKKGREAIVSYSLACVLFVISLLSKSAAVTLPAILLLVDYYQHRKFTASLLLEKIPFLAGAIILGVMAIKGQQSQGTLSEGAVYSITGRMFIACYSYIFYIVKFIIPVKLSAFYPYPLPLRLAAWPFLYQLSPLGVIVTVALAYYFRRNKAFVFGFLFFSITIIFLVHFVPVGATITADRFSYIPFIGLSFIVAFCFENLVSGGYLRSASKALFIVPGILIIAILGFAAHQRCRVWKDSVTLWRDVLDKNPNNPYVVFISNEHSGTALIQIGQTEEAISHFLKALEINPRDAKAHYNLGNALMQERRTAEAVAEYRKALNIDPDYAMAHHNLAVALQQLGRIDEAVVEYRKALSINPYDALAHFNLADALLRHGLTDDAIFHYRKAVDLDPWYFDAYCNLGVALMQMHRTADAVVCFQNALNAAPADLTTLSNLCVTFMKIERADLAIIAAEKAMSLAKSTGRKALAQEIAGKIEELRRTTTDAR
jgi:tetratricopeptide (TPR) repeat protein